MVLEVPEMKTTESSESLEESSIALSRSHIPPEALASLSRMGCWVGMPGPWAQAGHCQVLNIPLPIPLHFQDTGGQQGRKQHVFCEQL